MTVSALLREWILERLRLERRLAHSPSMETIRDQIVQDILQEIPGIMARSMERLEALQASLEASSANRGAFPQAPAQASA
jgi:hypothetical protein